MVCGLKHFYPTLPLISMVDVTIQIKTDHISLFRISFLTYICDHHSLPFFSLALFITLRKLPNFKNDHEILK